MKKVVLTLLFLMLGISSEQATARWWVGASFGPYYGGWYPGWYASWPYWGAPRRRRVRRERVVVQQPTRRRIPTQKISTSKAQQETTDKAQSAQQYDRVEKRATKKVITPSVQK